MGMTMTEKILARAAGRTTVAPGDLVDIAVDTCVAIDMNFLPGMWRQLRHVWDAEKVVVFFDHIVPAKGCSCRANTPTEAIANLNAATNKVLHAPEMAKSLMDLGLEAAGSSPQQLEQSLAKEGECWGRVINATNIKAE